MRKWPTLTLLSALLAGCAVGPDYQRPAVVVPTDWPQSLELTMDEQLDWARWWTRYQDPTLERLVAEAMQNNLDVLIAAARVEQARALLGLAEAERYPTLQAQADVTRGESNGSGSLPSSGPRTTYSIVGVLNYEVDLWGRLSRETEAARAQLLQIAFTEEAVRLSLITDLVTSYFDFRALQRQIRITQETIESRRAAYRLEQSRVRNGASTELNLRQTEAELARAEAQLPLLVRQAQQLLRVLAVLTGSNPTKVIAPDALPEQELSAIAFSTALPRRLPSELLERRPDIRAAEAGLIAANADIGAARAAWLPRLNFAASAGTAAIEPGDLFTGPAAIWQLGGSILAPLLDFGRRESQIAAAEAARDIAELQYRATIRDAFLEVGDAWTLLQTSTERLDALNRQVRALEVAVDLAERRYRNGYSPLLELLDARRLLFDAQLAQTEAVRDRLAATAVLFKALAGGWETGAEGENQRAAEAAE